MSRITRETPTKKNGPEKTPPGRNSCESEIANYGLPGADSLVPGVAGWAALAAMGFAFSAP